ncbi:MAG: hypothetical protein GX946_07870 [Oligosphaeraceae bacterium]|nr:hypothetical protein [Oligosphaeraceae bacterium]
MSTSKLTPLADYVYLSSSCSFETFMVERDGVIWRLSPSPKAVFQDGHRGPALFDWRQAVPGTAHWRWRQGWLPVLEISDENTKLEFFATGNELWLRHNEGHHVQVFTADGDSCDANINAFEAGLTSIQQEWYAFFAGTPEPEPLPGEERAAWRSTIVQGFLAGCGNHPKYGVGSYHDRVHDGFPPQTIAMVDMLLELGKHEAAGRRLEYYLERFVQADGTIDYYGPAISEYGMILSLGARCALSPSGAEWTRRNAAGMTRIIRMLSRLGNFILHPGEQRFPGLLCGIPEADTHDRPAIYTHNNAWIWRGLREWSQAAAEKGLTEAAAECAMESERLGKALRSALDANRLSDGLPPYKLPSEEALPDFAANRDITYANYRYYLELLESGFLTREEALTLIQAREERNGELEGMTLFNFRAAFPSLTKMAPFCIDNWPIASYGIALANLGERQRLHQVIHSHYLYDLSPDTFTAYESIDAEIEGDTPRRAFTDWCVPVQLAYPRMLSRYSRMLQDNTNHQDQMI